MKTQLLMCWSLVINDFFLNWSSQTKVSFTTNVKYENLIFQTFADLMLDPLFLSLQHIHQKVFPLQGNYSALP